MRDCHLTQIAEDALARLTDLTELKLDRNNLTWLPNKLLAGSPRLEQVGSNQTLPRRSRKWLRNAKQCVTSSSSLVADCTAPKIALKIAVARATGKACSLVSDTVPSLKAGSCTVALSCRAQILHCAASVTSRKAPSRSLLPLSPPETVSCPPETMALLHQTLAIKHRNDIGDIDILPDSQAMRWNA